MELQTFLSLLAILISLFTLVYFAGRKISFLETRLQNIENKLIDPIEFGQKIGFLATRLQNIENKLIDPIEFGKLVGTVQEHSKQLDHHSKQLDRLLNLFVNAGISRTNKPKSQTNRNPERQFQSLPEITEAIDKILEQNKDKETFEIVKIALLELPMDMIRKATNFWNITQDDFIRMIYDYIETQKQSATR